MNSRPSMARRRAGRATRALRPLVSAAAALVAVTMTSCTSTPEATPPETYTPPAWMAELAAFNEQSALLQVECMARAGYAVKAGPNDGSLSGSDPKLDNASHDEWLAATEAQSEASYRCFQEATEQMGPPPGGANPDGDTRYRQMSETAECVRANGYPEIGQPPSRDAWLDAESSRGVDLWSAYSELYKLHPDITEQAWDALKLICVEGGAGFSVGFHERPSAEPTS